MNNIWLVKVTEWLMNPRSLEVQLLYYFPTQVDEGAVPLRITSSAPALPLPPIDQILAQTRPMNGTGILTVPTYMGWFFSGDTWNCLRPYGSCLGGLPHLVVPFSIRPRTH